MIANQMPARAPRPNRVARFALVIIALLAVNSANVCAAERPLLTTAVINGSTVYSPAQLFAAYRDQLGRPITRENAQAITAALAELYRQDGYARPELRLDDALVARGILRIDVFEPHIARVTINGVTGRYRDELEKIADDLRQSRPLRSDDLQQALAAMRQFPGLSVTATTQRDEAVRNAHELVVEADFSPIDGVVRMNNRGTEQVGRSFLLGQVIANGLLGWHEKIGLVFAAATDHEEYLGGGLYLDTPLGARGTRGMAMIFHSDSAPNESPVNLTDEYTRERATLRITQPLQQDAGWNLAISGGFEADNLTVDRDGVQARDDRLRILEAGARLAWRAGEATQYSATLELRQGLDGLGSGLQASDLPNDRRRSDFLLAQLQASSLTRLNMLWSFRVDAFAQQTGYVLPDSERFKIGGDRLGRGFEVPEIAGDQGLGGKVELRRDLTNADSFLGRTSAYGFYDIGAAWKQDQSGRVSAATAGTGVALHGTRLMGYLEVAKPLTHPDVEGKRDASVFAELSFRF